MSLAADLRPDLKVKFSFGTEANVPDWDHQEFLSFPDLAAGALAHGFSKAVPVGTPIPPGTPPTRPKAAEILRWMAWQRIGLKKALFWCRPEGPGLRGRFGSLTTDAVPDEMQFVPITPK